MEINKHNCFTLAHYYLQATAGELLYGTIHNINNYLHVLDMQLELFNNKMDSIKTGDSQGLEKSFSRLTHAAEGISNLIQETGKRQFYVQTDLAQVDISEFLHWQQKFWANNLFFKHHINMEMEINPDAPSSLQLPPFLLTLCLEQVLKNALEACQADSGEHFELKIEISPYKSGLNIALYSPTLLPAEEESPPFDPWEQGSTLKSGHLGLGLPLVWHCTQAAGWDCTLSCQDQKTKFELNIPNLKTAV